MAEAVILRKSTGEIINYNYNVTNPLNQIVGLDPDLEVLLKYIPYPEPEYDSRLYQLVITNDATAEQHPDYPLYNQYRTTYQTQKRINDEIILAAQNAESLANEDHKPKHRQAR